MFEFKALLMQAKGELVVLGISVLLIIVSSLMLLLLGEEAPWKLAAHLMMSAPTQGISQYCLLSEYVKSCLIPFFYLLILFGGIFFVKFTNHLAKRIHIFVKDNS